MALEKDFKEFIELLNEHNVKYLVVGGFAVNFHGYPRYTKDIDFWIWMTENNIKKLLNAIADFGFGGLDLTTNDLMNPNNIVQLGYEPHRIDLILDVDGIDFESCYKKRIEKKLDNVKIKFLALEDLIKAKKSCRRLQDLADAEELEKIRLQKKNK